MPFPRAKGTCYDGGLRVPFLAWAPGRIQPGVRDELLWHLDLAATWIDLAGAERYAKMQGRSFANLLLGRDYKARESVFASRNWHDNFDPSRAVRTSRYKLIYNGSPTTPYRPIADLAASPTWQSYVQLWREGKLSPEHVKLMDPVRPVFELYDVQADPSEFYNLATSRDHQQALSDLKRRLSDWMHETYDYLPPPYRQPQARADDQRLSFL